MPKKPRLSGDTDMKPYVPSIALRSIDGHVTHSKTTVTAWYRLPAQRWSFRSDEERWSLIQAIAGQYADLQGRWLHIRVTSRPFPVPEWAKAHIRNARDPLPDISGALSFDDYMLGEQRQLQGRAMNDKEVYLGVEIRRRNLVDTLVDTSRPLLHRVAPSLLAAEDTAIDSEIRHVDAVVSGTGLQAQPATAEEMRWLMDRSCNLGLPAPRPDMVPGSGTGQWQAEDLAALTEGSDAWQEPYAPTATVRGRGGDLYGIQRDVAVLSLGLMDKLTIPEHDPPWMQQADAVGIPLEWSARMYIRPPEQVEGEMVHQMSKVRSQVKHFVDEHDIEPPQDLARQSQRASDIEAEINGQFGATNTRVKGWWRVAVSGADRDEALNNAQQLLRRYKPRIALEHPEAQYHMMREFIPGEPLASQGYMRRGSVTWAASGVPAATASVGDRRGVMLGETTGFARHPVAWDPWMAQEIRNSSGLTAVVAGLGGGKSFLGGGLVYKTLRAGAHWTILDPSGPLAKLCEMPELRPYARTINLLKAEPGILNPYRVVPEPDRNDFDDVTDWRQERADAAATRTRLCQDVLMGVLPAQLREMPETYIVLLRAIRQVGGSNANHPGMVIDVLAQDSTEHAQHARVIYEALDSLRGRLRPLIPESGSDPYDQLRDDRLTVLTMPGLSLPSDKANPQNWSDAERLGAELLSLAGWLTQHRVYTGTAGNTNWKDVRKGVWIDEAFFLSEVAAGRHLMDRFARDSRKWNVRVLLSSQLPTDFLRIDDSGFASLVDSVFVGRLADREAQSAALRLLQVPTGVGYERVLSELAPPSDLGQDTENGPEPDKNPRQFVFADGARGVERIRVDFSGPHLEGLRDALETTPGAPKPTETVAPQQAETDSSLLDSSHPPDWDSDAVRESDTVRPFQAPSTRESA